jgi:hypothetical protein
VFGDLFFESKPMASKSWIANGSTSMVVFTAPKEFAYPHLSSL